MSYDRTARTYSGAPPIMSPRFCAGRRHQPQGRQALGLEISLMLLARANEAIE
jgi:hypothetical protein